MIFQKTHKFIQHEIVLIVACLVASVSAFFVKPSENYISYIDFSVLAILFCLMLVVAGLIKSNLFDVISSKILKTTCNVKTVSIFLVNITFFCAMLVTNDVALITFVPLTIGLLGSKHQNQLIYVIVMETIAANLGSMITPIGNPQNLYLYSYYNMNILTFFKIILPIGILSYLLITLTMLFRKSEQMSFNQDTIPNIENKFNFILYIILFALCVLTVLRVVDYRVCLAITTITIYILDKKLFKKVDISLLITFVAFFIFVGNLSNINIVKDMILKFINGKELISSIALSQVISNVPTAIMLSGFTQNVKELLVGVNIGGLGTIVASLASLISYKLYAKSECANTKRYLIVFTVLNFGFLVFLTLGYWLCNCIFLHLKM
ncbi:MAG: SLC13 family permease [Oscillospiraceae bacterium]